LEDQSRNTEVITNLAQILLASTTAEDRRSMEGLSMCRVMIPHLKNVNGYVDSLRKANVEDRMHKLFQLILDRLGELYLLAGDVQYARKAYEQRLQIREVNYSRNYTDLAITLRSLSKTLGLLGRYRNEKLLLEYSLHILEHFHGKENVEVANTLCQLGKALESLGNYAEMKSLLERALVIQENYYGADSIEVASTLNDLSLALGFLGDYRGMKLQLERASVIDKDYYSADHIKMARMLDNLGLALGFLGDYRGMKLQLERALVIEEGYYGADHIEVAKTLANLGNALGYLGNHERERSLLERSLAIQEHYYGPDHIKVAVMLTNLGGALLFLGDYKQAKLLLERAIVIEEDYYSVDHIWVAATLGNLAIALGSLGDHEQARLQLERVLKIQESYYDPYHIEVAQTLFHLSKCYSFKKLYVKQKELLEKALYIEETNRGLFHLGVSRTLHRLGLALGNLGHYEQELKLLLSISKVYESYPYFTSNNLEVIHLKADLANAHAHNGNSSYALRLINTVYNEVRANPTFDKDHLIAREIRGYQNHITLNHVFAKSEKLVQQLDLLENATALVVRGKIHPETEANEGHKFFCRWDAQPEQDSYTHEPVFTFRFFNDENDTNNIGSVKFYGQPLLCRSEDSARNNIIEIEGIAKDWQLKSTASIEEICRVLPPTLIDKIILQVVSSAVHGFRRGLSKVIGLAYRSVGFSDQFVDMIIRLCDYGSYFCFNCVQSLYNTAESGLTYRQELANAFYNSLIATGKYILFREGINVISSILTWAGQKLETRGHTQAGTTSLFLGRYGHFSLFMYDVITNDAVSTATSVVTGTLAQVLTEKAGEAAINRVYRN